MCGGEYAADALFAQSADGAAIPFPKRFASVARNGAKRGERGKRERDEKNRNERKEQDGNIQRNIFEAGKIGRSESEKAVQAPIGNKNTERAPDEGEEESFGEELANETIALRAKSGTDGELEVLRDFGREVAVELVTAKEREQTVKGPEVHVH